MSHIGVCVSVNHTCIVSILAQGPTNELVEVGQSQGGEDERRVDTKVACCSLHSLRRALVKSGRHTANFVD